MSFTARAYIGCVLAVGAAALAQALFLWNPQDLPRFFCYLALAAPAAGLKVRLPGITGTMSVLFLFVLAGIVELSLAETVAIGAICVVVQSYWRAKVRPRAVQVAFSVANVSFAVSAAYYVYRWQWLPVAHLEGPFRLAAAATVYFLTNTFPVAAVIALTEGKPLRKMWSRCYFWTFPYYLVGAALVGAFGFANRLLNWQAWVLILPVVYVIYRSYGLYLDQLETERKHAEEVASLHAQAMNALASAITANAKLEAVIQASPLAIIALDREGRITSWNAMAERMFGWSAEEICGQLLPFTGENPSGSLEAILAGGLNGQPISGLELTERRKDGSRFEAGIWTAPLRAPGEQIAGVLVTVADVSDHKRLEEQLRLSQKMEAVGRLAGGIAHDFNNLLTVINGYGTMLVESIKYDPYARSQAEEILNAGNRAAGLVSRLLTFSRHQVVKPKPVEINRLVLDVERMLRRLIGEHIQLNTALAGDAGWTLADPNQMEAVLINLATNARDAMPDGGTLSIATARVNVLPGQPCPALDLPAGDYIRLLVADTGLGMDTRTQQHLFEPFFTTKEKGKGTGLGLSSVYASVAQCHGHILVASELGQGTAFSIYLPACEQPGGPETPAVPSRAISRGNETILLVEDETMVRRMLREALSRAGYRVWEAGHGAEALDHWGSEVNEIALVVTDIVMPVMNGLKLADELKKRRPDLKLIFMSGHAEDMITRQNNGLELPEEFLAKPFLPDVLVSKVREVLDQRAAKSRGTTDSGFTV